MGDNQNHKWQLLGAILVAIIGGIFGYILKPSPEAPPKDIDFIMTGYSNGTIIILNEWRVFSEQYPNRLEEELHTSLLNIQLVSKEEILTAHKKICTAFKYVLDKQLASEHSNPIEINPKIRAFFGEIRMDTTSIEAESRRGQAYCEKFFDLNLEAILMRNTMPVNDSLLNKHISNYVNRRQKILELCQGKVANWYHVKANKW